MQLDQAAWHTASKLKIPDNILLIKQPAYSPELNPIECLWDYIKENDFRNRYFENLDLVEE